MAKGFYDIYTKDGSKAGSCGTRVEEMGTAGIPEARSTGNSRIYEATRRRYLSRVGDSDQ